MSVLPIGIDNSAFLLDKLAAECDDYQLVRELTQNAFDAGATEVHWDVDWSLWRRTRGRIYKLSCLDNGRGMTPLEMARLLNRLSASGHVQGPDANFGMGAKLGVLTRNPAGVVYRSWKNGHGAEVVLRKDPRSGQYGIWQEESDDLTAFYRPLTASDRPRLIAEHGTQVTLLGRSAEESTIEPPPGARTPSRWVSAYLNQRYFRVPPQVVVRCREGWHNPPDDVDRNVRRTVKGQQSFLESFSSASGVVSLEDASAHWWILSDDPARAKQSDHVVNGHVAMLHGDELYDLRSQVNRGYERLQEFGITFGMSRVVIYVEPAAMDAHAVQPNAARSALLRGNRHLSYADWVAEFRMRLPRALRDHVSASAPKGDTPAERDRETARQLQQVAPLYAAIAGAPATPPKRSKPKTSRPTRNAPRAPREGRTPRRPPQKRYGGQPLPRVQWVVPGGESHALLHGFVARYMADPDNLLFIDSGHPRLTAITAVLAKMVPPDGLPLVDESVKTSVQTILTEVVLGARIEAGARNWTREELGTALSEPALTAAVTLGPIKAHVDRVRRGRRIRAV